MSWLLGAQSVVVAVVGARPTDSNWRPLCIDVYRLYRGHLFQRPWTCQFSWTISAACRRCSVYIIKLGLLSQASTGEICCTITTDLWQYMYLGSATLSKKTIHKYRHLKHPEYAEDIHCQISVLLLYRVCADRDCSVNHVLNRSVFSYIDFVTTIIWCYYYYYGWLLMFYRCDIVIQDRSEKLMFGK